MNLLLQVNNNRTTEWGPYLPPPDDPSWGGHVPDPHIPLCCNQPAGLAGPMCRTIMCPIEYLLSNDTDTPEVATNKHPTDPALRSITSWCEYSEKKWRWQIDEAPVWFALLWTPCRYKTAPAHVPSLGKMHQNMCHRGKLGTFKGLWYSHSSALCTSPPLRVCVSAHLFIAPHWQKKERHPLARGKCPN